ncbi:MAG: aconitase X catalytic domain-containing protein [Candidatus Schekmanbacteria bacterium]|nr:aconitase X catalytic domain-containing protein [Candidatus Schekmanbacteria bacterium]
MRLTAEQDLMMSGAHGSVLQRQMRLLARLGTVFGATEMVPIHSVQVSGVSYKSLGDPGLEFLEDLASQGARVRVATTLNPAGMDLHDWREMGVPADFAEKQLRIMAAFRALGISASPTCAPYLTGNVPRAGEHVAWAESSAVSYANSVLGARTNREGGPSALAAALCGCTPKHGLHLSENRQPHVVVEVAAKVTDNADFGALGYLVGKKVKNRVPYFRGLEVPRNDDLKALGAAMAASGAVALFHVEGVTPEAGDVDVEDLPAIVVPQEELDATYQALSSTEEAQLIVVGCPHASLSEIAVIAEKVRGRRLAAPLWICTARATKDEAVQLGLDEVIQAAGGRIVADTCMVVSPLERMGVDATAVTSGKAASYLPGFCSQRVLFRRLDDLLRGGGMPQ